MITTKTPEQLWYEVQRRVTKLRNRGRNPCAEILLEDRRANSLKYPAAQRCVVTGNVWAQVTGVVQWVSSYRNKTYVDQATYEMIVDILNAENRVLNMVTELKELTDA